MKYIVIPFFKMLWAIIIFSLLCMAFLIVNLIILLWNFSYNDCFSIMEALEYDTNDGWAEKDEELVFKTPFHWALNIKNKSK